ncbi:F0F1 ATP synthase subunit gamma [Allonocardiopsis opalescens]|uniref:ATP synthase gamma chain n=1 Tax=Allonocardiopsis opalescens TaxID=1144618 RepID=A0A2T0QD41_9ACTN|nr:F0F1 ATP synthase subunit gamma [Allonocardiopsis opalescens]PRY01791.1 ATP synthase F1 subcomplex gamma subunit [Allonocardiopsis opalescens]
MGAELRVLRRRIRSVKSMAKITRAMELIAATRITKAQQRAAAAGPYSREITRAVSAVAGYQSTDHPLLTEAERPTRAAVLLITSDKGLAGAYTSNAIKEAESLTELLRSEGKEVLTYIVGIKGITYYTFRERPLAGSWERITEVPSYADAKEIGDALMAAFTTPTEEGGVDEIHIVSTEFVSMLSQRAAAHRVLPLEVEEVSEQELRQAHGGQALPLYEFEPSAEAVLDSLLPRYVNNRIYFALLESAASQQASRRAAMKAATDNAQELAKVLARQANAARQAEITQEISEIVGGANALADAQVGSEN